MINFSRYKVGYIQNIVYMLQASEYEIKRYLSWYHQTKDFDKVQTRKKLDKTIKSRLLIIISWLIIISFIFFFSRNAFLFLLSIFLAPYFLAYAIIIPTFFIKQLIQKPIEFIIIKKTKKKIKEIKALKIAIAGSYGKTTMREILRSVLSEFKNVSAPGENYNTPIGVSRFARSLNGKEDIIIFEMGEYRRKDIKKLSRIINPEIGIITGINEAHLERFKNIAKTQKTIYELAEHKTIKKLYVNSESRFIDKGIKQIEYSQDLVGPWKISNKKTDLSGTSFTMTKKDMEINLRSGLLGTHQIGPIALAASIAFSLGASIDQIKKGVEKTKSFPHRLEKKKIDDVILIDDSYNGNPDGFKVAIDFLSKIKGYRRFYVTPGLVEMGKESKNIHYKIGQQLSSSGIENIVLIENSVTKEIEKGLKDNGFQGNLIWFKEMNFFFREMPHITVSGDLVLIQNDWSDQYK